MWRKPVVWIVLVLVSLAGAAVAGAHFDRAFPVVALELDMDRAEALDAARDRARREAWPTADDRQAASFGLRDGQVQTYVELEAGGAGAWQRILESDPYRPYAWRVRQFREGETHETEVRFAPDGAPVGFRLTLPEDEPGPVLAADSARGLAEAGAAAWGVALDSYELVEVSDETMPGGRMDRTFVYQRDAADLYGDARARLRVKVAGDRVTEVTHFIEVPEGFSRRYSELRSRNDLIALIASLAVGVLYLGGGCGLALLLLLRAGWVQWRMAVVWGAVVGALMFLASLNQLPLAWMDYDTAVPASSFLTEQVLFAVAAFVGTTLFLSLVFMAGETLDRRVFPGHVRLWRSWDRDVARSDTGLGHALGGYVFTGFFVVYVVGFYLLVTRGLGWWTPSEAVVQPDLLATSFPWISGAATSLFAGFSEEALFRAVPLAGAVLLAERFGGRKAWLAGALVLQALIFAAAHANYPQQPSYARLVELFLPALGLGVIYLRFGFMPVVIAHFTYDLTWFSLPLFAFEGAWFSKGITVVLGLVPLGIVLVARARHGATAAAPGRAWNRAWSPDRRDEEAAEPGHRREPGLGEPPEVGAPREAAGVRDGGEPPDVEETREAGAPREPGAPPARVAEAPDRAEETAETGPADEAGPARRAWLELPWVGTAGLVGIALWMVAVRMSSDAPPLDLPKSEARTVAREVVAARGAGPGPDWQELVSTHASVSQEHRFVWQTAGRGVYRILVSEHLPGPHWHVRWVRFEGPVEERAEEYLVTVGPDAEDTRFRHRLPESRALPSLSEADARAVAERALLDAYGMPPETLELVTAEADQLPERMDWTFTFRVPAVVRLPEGEARASVQVSGDRVTDLWRFVHVPETWEREDRSRQTFESTLTLVGGGLLLLLGLGALITAVVRWSRGSFDVRAFAAVALAIFLLAVVQQVNGWPSVVAAFSTAQPFRFQLFAALAGAGIGSLVVAAVTGVLSGFGHAGRTGPARGPLVVGTAAGFLLVGVLAVVDRLRPGLEPAWPDVSGAAAFLPGAAPLLDAAMSYITLTTLALAGLALLRLVAARRWAPPALALVAGMGMAGIAAGSVTAWLAGALLAGIMVYGVHHLERAAGRAIVPGLVAVLLGVDVLALGIQAPYPGAAIGAALGLVAIAALAGFWTRALTARETA